MTTRYRIWWPTRKCWVFDLRIHGDFTHGHWVTDVDLLDMQSVRFQTLGMTAQRIADMLHYMLDASCGSHAQEFPAVCAAWRDMVIHDAQTGDALPAMPLEVQQAFVDKQALAACAKILSWGDEDWATWQDCYKTATRDDKYILCNYVGGPRIHALLQQHGLPHRKLYHATGQTYAACIYSAWALHVMLCADNNLDFTEIKFIREILQCSLDNTKEAWHKLGMTWENLS